MILFFLDNDSGDKHAAMSIGTAVFRTEIYSPAGAGSPGDDWDVRQLTAKTWPRPKPPQADSYPNALDLLCFDRGFRISAKNYGYIPRGSVVPQLNKENKKEDRAQAKVSHRVPTPYSAAQSASQTT